MAGTSGTVAADVYANMIERVRKGKAEQYFQQSNNNITRLIPDAENVGISGRNYWIRFQNYVGGTFGFVSFDGGAWVQGSGSLYDRFQAAVKEFQYIQKITDRAKNQTDSGDKAAESVYMDLFKQGMKQMNEYRDVLFHGDGTGKVTAGAASVTTWASGAKSVYTFSKSSDYIGLQRVIEGMGCYVFDSDATTQLYNGTLGATAPIFVEKVNRETGEVFLSTLINSASPGAGDFLTFYGISSATSFANYSGGFTSPAVSPDASVHGLYYFNDVNTSNYMDGKLKSDYPQIIPSRIDGTGMTYTARLAMNLIHKIAEHWGDDPADMGIIATAPRAQFDALVVEQQQVMVVNNQTVQAKFDDRIPSELEGPRPKATISGIPHYTDSRQYRNRVDFIIPKKWGRVKNLDLTPLEVDQKTVWRGHTSTGVPEYTLSSGWQQSMNYVCFAPGFQGYIDNLSIANGYKA